MKIKQTDENTAAKKGLARAGQKCFYLNIFFKFEFLALGYFKTTATMKNLLYVLTIFLLTSCSNTTDKNKSDIASEQTDVSKEQTELILGERIDGPANILDTVNGKILFSLDDNVLVETSPEKQKWQLVGLYVSLTDKQLDELKIYPNSDLRSTDGQIIGKTKDTVELWIGEDERIGFIGAYTHIDNIKKHTIPEIALEEEIAKGNLTLKALKSYLTAFRFEDYEGNEEIKYKQLYIGESTVVDPSPRDRITLLFDKEDNLIGVIHSRQLNLKNFRTYELIRGHSLTIFADLDKNEVKRIMDERINFYNSVD